MVIHYDNGNFELMPYSGRHTVVACGAWLQDSYIMNHSRKTDDKKSVTCKNCIKKINKLNKD